MYTHMIILFSIGESDKSFKEYVVSVLPDDYYIDFKDDEICGFTESHRGRTWHHLIGGQTIVRLPKRPVTPVEFGTLSHEIFHAVDYIFRRIGMKLGADSDEAYAYLIGYVTEQFWKEIKGA